MRVVRLIGLALVLALFACPPLFAQTDTGSVDGRILDEQKATMPGVTITAKNVATGLTRTAQSSAGGTYHFESLPAGKYDLTAEIQGFSKAVQTGVTVQVGSSTTADFTLKVGALSETVTVSAEPPLVQTTRSDVGQVISQSLVENMPLNGRKFQDLSLLVPGTRAANYYDPTKTEVGGVSYGGLSGRSVNITVDGGDNNDGVVRGILQQFSADAIQEYKVTTERYSAEFGRSTGGLVNVITKSGTNEFHGTGYVFARNDKLNATTYFEKLAIASGTQKEKSPFSQQQPGGTIGGPIKKDKAHFFVSYEYNRRNDYANVFTNGVLPSQEGAFPKPFRDHLLTAKADFEVAPGNTFTVRYGLEDQKRQHDFIGGSTLASAGAANTNMIHSFIAKDSAVLGSSKLNEFIVLYQHFENNITADNNTNPGIATPDFTFGANLNTPQQTIQRRIQIRDDFSFRKDWNGDHDFKVGGELIRSHFGGFFTPTLYGLFTFNNRLPGANANNINAYLNAIADSFSGSAGTTAFDDNWTYVATYFQDDWKMKDNVTLNLGMRWETQVGPYQNNRQTPALTTLQAAGFSSQKSQDLKDFGPRAGFAWDVRGDGKTVVRAGYGLYYDEIFQNVTLYEYWSDVRQPVNFLSLSPAPFTAAQYAANPQGIRNSFLDPTFAGQRIQLLDPNLRQPYAHQFNVGFSHQITPRISVDADVIHALGRQEIARWWLNKGYSVVNTLTGVTTVEKNQSTAISPAGVFDPTHGEYRVEGNRDYSRVDGLLVTGKMRMSRAQFITTYSLTKAQNTANDFNSSPNDLTNLNWAADYGPTANDVRHRFTLGGVFDLTRGFQISSSVQANTGKPYNAVVGYGGARIAVRPIDPTTGLPFGRNSFVGPGYATWDVRFAKTFTMPASRSFEVLFEVFNITDRVNFNGDTGTGFQNIWGKGPTPSPGFGTPTNIVPNSQRQAEFGVRYRF
jgi:hypothetical protein